MLNDDDGTIVCDGLFKIMDNCEIYKLKKNEYVKAKQSHTCRNGRYLSVSIMCNKKQKHFLVHRLIATALIPNPSNYPQINHLDGNPSNNSMDNLEWCTAKMNVQHAFATGLMKTLKDYGVVCQRCGELSTKLDDSNVCGRCQRTELRNKKQKEKTETELLEKLKTVNFNILKPREVEMIEQRLEGKKYREIADAYGVSRQCVEQIISRCAQKSSCIRDTADKVWTSANKQTAKQRENKYYQKLYGCILCEYRSLLTFCNQQNLNYPNIINRFSKGSEFGITEAITISKMFPNHELESLFAK